MKNILILTFVTMLLSSCMNSNQSENFKSFSWNDFEKNVTLKGRIISFNDAIMKPFAIQIRDSVLITLEPANDMVCQLFNLHTETKIGDRLMIGEGPNEMMMPMFVNNGENIEFVDLASSVVYSYKWDEFIGNSMPQPNGQIKLAESVDSEMQVLGENYIGYQYFKNQLLYKFDKNGQKTGGLAGFPDGAGEEPNEKRSDMYQMGYVSNGKDKVAITYYMTDLIEILDVNGNYIKRLHGPELFDYSDDGKDAFFSPKNAGTSFFVLYNGGYRREEGHSSSCYKLLSFSWDGKPECVYTLDDPIFTYCVDVEHRKIYGVSTTPEYHIVEYSY